MKKLKIAAVMIVTLGAMAAAFYLATHDIERTCAPNGSCKVTVHE